ncbi:MAG TPA: SH3 domain-containing protein [Planctomycetota bacterium]|nr:SH3 domain-containing protein [Planctomycetota bacterium]
MRLRSRFALWTILVLAVPAARADEPTPAPAEPEPVVALVSGDRVNLRAGPRQDDAAVTQMPQGTVLLIVERAGEWLGVRMPSGFSGAVSTELTVPVDDEHVRVEADEVNLRRGPGTEHPAFRDLLARGTVLPVLAREGEWTWVEAPEEIRAYVHSAFVKEVGPLSENLARVEGARAERTVREELRNRALARTTSDADDAAVRAEIGAVAKALADLRGGGGYDVAPVAALEDRLSTVLESKPSAADRTKALARVLIEDLDREQQMRVAFADDILAKRRMGQAPPAAPAAPAPKLDSVDATGVVRWEPAPGWEGGGAFVLWVDGKPAHALRWASGDLKALAAEPSVRVRGKGTGTRLLGLPLLDVASFGPGAAGAPVAPAAPGVPAPPVAPAAPVPPPPPPTPPCAPTGPGGNVPAPRR